MTPINTIHKPDGKGNGTRARKEGYKLYLLGLVQLKSERVVPYFEND